MGTLGGKIGFVCGLPVSFLSISPVEFHVMPGPCFLEEGCGLFEGMLVLLGIVVAIAIGVISGLLIRAAINRVVLRQD